MFMRLLEKKRCNFQAKNSKQPKQLVRKDNNLLSEKLVVTKIPRKHEITVFNGWNQSRPTS